jgi:excisionase family DNA binding protein
MSNQRNPLTSPYLTKVEAAEYLRVCVNTIDNLSNRGVLKPKRVQGVRKVLFHVDELENALFTVSTRSRRSR